MIRMRITFLALSFVCMAGAVLYAQAFDFEPFPLGPVPTGGPGSLALSENNIDMSVAEFHLGGFIGFNSIRVDNPATGSFFPPALDPTQTLTIDNMDVEFDLTNLGFDVGKVAIEYVDLGGDENFDINRQHTSAFGSPVQLPRFSTLPGGVIPGYNVNVVPAGVPVPGGEGGVIEVTALGPNRLEKILYGGQEFAIDNLRVIPKDVRPRRLHPKFVQRPMLDTLIDNRGHPGHDEISTAFSVRDPQNPKEVIGYDGRWMADDFADCSPHPVQHLTWWGSYKDNEIIQAVDRFLVVFEKDVPAGVDTEFSHPDGKGEKFAQVVTRGQLFSGAGTFEEQQVTAGNVEDVFRYDAELRTPFKQEPDTVYWLKIVALVDLPVDHRPGDLVTEWGWHNRDYTLIDPYASKPPDVKPGERVVGEIGNDPARKIFHFQDDAVTGTLFAGLITPGVVPDIQQEIERPTHYLDGLDGPDGIGQFSKDLAFSLDWWALVGDMDGNGTVDAFDVDDFEIALADRAHYAQLHPCLDPILLGDIDGSGALDAFDVDDFEKLLAGSPGPAIPEPGVCALLLLGGWALMGRRGVRQS